MSSVKNIKVVLFVCTITFMLSAHNTSGSTLPKESKDFKKYRESGLLNERGMEGEDSGKDIRYGWLSLGGDFPAKYQSYSGTKVDGLRGSNKKSLFNVINSKILKPEKKYVEIDGHAEASATTSDRLDSQNNHNGSAGDSLLKPDSLDSSRNITLSNDTEIVKPLNNETGYQSDSSQQAELPGFWQGPVEVIGLPSTSMLHPPESTPFVLCGSDSMTLTVNENVFERLKIDRVGSPPLLLSQLSSSCEHTIEKMKNNFALMTSYDGCYVVKKGDKYILPLLWLESPVNLSCPAPVPSPSPFSRLSVLCSPFGMILNFEGGPEAAEKFQIMMQGVWVPFLYAQCGYPAQGNAGELIVYIPYTACGMKIEDGMRVLTLHSGEKEKPFVCPLFFVPSPPFSHPAAPVSFSHPVAPAPFSHPESSSAHHPQPPEATLPPHLSDSMYSSFHSHPQTAFPGHPPNTGYLGTHQSTHNDVPQDYHPHNSIIPSMPLHTSANSLSSVPFPIPHLDPSHRYPPLPHYPQPPPAPLVLPFPPSFQHHSAATAPSVPPPSLICTANTLMVSLPSATLGTIEVKGPSGEWINVSSAPGDCFYNLQTFGIIGATLSSPLPPCYAHTLTPGLITLPVKFFDAELGQHRIFELQCPYYSPTATASPPTPHPSHIFPPSPPKLQPYCSEDSMSVRLPPGYEWALQIQDVRGIGITQSGDHRDCGYSVNKEQDGTKTLHVPFNSCHVSVQGNQRVIVLKYRTLYGQEGEVPLSCQLRPPIKKQGCEISGDMRLPCGPGFISLADCETLGCCYCPHSWSCYYPMDECTADRHIVFTVPASLTDPPLSTSSLFTPGNTTCLPQKFTPSYALFKIPLDDCGVHKYDIGQTTIYMVEVLNTLYAISLNYGTITRDSPVRLIVECRYSSSSHVSVAYLVKSPTLGPSIHAQGVFGVQLRIAKDQHYTDYYPQYHRPLSLLLGHPLYLEVRLLNPPDPSMVLRVLYCLAYPRSGQAVWVLVYDGCANQLDTTPHHRPAPNPSPLSATRRFTFDAFQFLSAEKGTYLDEEIYFMCFTEVCSEGCAEECFISPSSGQ